MKILIVGLPRSGTSLTTRIIRRNPLVKIIYFENFILLDRGNRSLYDRKGFFKKYKSLAMTKHFGEKIIWTKRNRGKAFANITPIDYCRKWNEIFGEEARILHIVRHPMDSWNSLFHLRTKQRRAKNIKEQFEWYKEYVGEMTEELLTYENCLSFKYEDLILDKSFIEKIYKFCGLPNYEIKEKLREKRAFAHKSHGLILVKEDYSNIIEVLNKVEGVVYE